MMRSTAVIRKEGMEILLRNLGGFRNRIFISSLLRDRFDYTEWQRDYFDKNFHLDDFLKKAAEYDQRNPFTGTSGP